MTGQTMSDAVDLYPLSMSQRAYRIRAMARRGGPSRWGRPHSPVNWVRSTMNLASPRPAPSERPPEGFDTPWSLAWDAT